MICTFVVFKWYQILPSKTVRSLTEFRNRYHNASYRGSANLAPNQRQWYNSTSGVYPNKFIPTPPRTIAAGTDDVIVTTRATGNLSIEGAPLVQTMPSQLAPTSSYVSYANYNKTATPIVQPPLQDTSPVTFTRYGATSMIYCSG